MCDRIRPAAKALNKQKWFSRQEVFNQADILLSDAASFRAGWNALRRRGELVKLGQEKYRYNEERAAFPKVRLRVYRAMHVKGAFCSADIAKLSDADVSYVQGLIRRLVKDGWLEFTGKKDRVKFFRVKNSEKFFLDKVRGSEGQKVRKPACTKKIKGWRP